MHTTHTLAALAAVAGLHSSAAASAAGVSLHFSADAAYFDTLGSSVEWTVEASFTGTSTTGYFGGFVGEFIAHHAQNFEVSGLTNLMSGQGTAPASDGGHISNINIFNSALLGTDDPANPLAIMTFRTSWIDVAPGTNTNNYLEYDAEGTASLFNSDFIFDLPAEFVDFVVTSDRVVYIPAPGASMALLGGLIATGRRRRSSP